MWPWARPQRILPATLWCWLAISLWLTLQPAYASTKRVDNSEQLRQALQHAEVGDNIHLNAGQYIGQFEITQAVSLSADKQAVIDAQGQGSALRVSSPNVIINGLTIRNWGRDLYQQDAAVHLAKGADQVQVKIANYMAQVLVFSPSILSSHSLVITKLWGAPAIHAR